MQTAVMQQLNKLLQWAQYHDESEQALTDEYPCMDGRLTGNSPGGTIPPGQSHSRAEQAHTLGLNDSSAPHGGASM